ncbi:hypothetical protein QD712_12265 [Streptomyces acidiscabies]|uniref:hypothetical protein n=1 Tax=Streptomyces acidiscabies TaxID=42234 RepID=UPI0030D497A3
MTGGRFMPGGNRDDLLVTFKDGHISLFTDLAANGLGKQTQITPTNAVWPHVGQLTTGSFTGSPRTTSSSAGVMGGSACSRGWTASGCTARPSSPPSEGQPGGVVAGAGGPRQGA